MTVPLTLATIGRFHFFEQAQGLRRHGALERFYCDDPRVLAAAGGRARWLAGEGIRKRWGREADVAGALARRGQALAEAAGGAQRVKINSAYAREAIRRGANEVWVDHGSLDEGWVARRMREEAQTLGEPLMAEGGNHSCAVLRARQAEEFATATGVIVASELARRSLAGEGVDAARIQVVPLGVDTARFRPSASARQTGEFRVLHAGPVTFNKGVHRLIAAFTAAALPSSELVLAGVAGDARVRRWLERAAGRARVRLAPPVAQGALPDLFAGFDVFVLASLADGFGLTVLQALACGLPVIVTDHCGCAEVLAGCPAARIVPAGDTAALAGALAEAYARRKEEWAGPAREWAGRLDWTRHARRLLHAISGQEGNDESA